MGHRSRAAARQNPIEVKPQRFTWKTAASYDRHAEALADKERREQDGQKLVKVKLRGERFEVRVGKPVKKAAPVVEEPAPEQPAE